MSEWICHNIKLVSCHKKLRIELKFVSFKVISKINLCRFNEYGCDVASLNSLQRVLRHMSVCYDIHNVLSGGLAATLDQFQTT